MARRSAPLPHALHRRAFTVSEAINAGMTRRGLESKGYSQPHHGIRRVVTEAESSQFSEALMRQNALNYLPLLRPGEAFSHTSALLLLGAPIHVPPSIHVTIARPSGQARGKGIFGHRSVSPLPIVEGPKGLPCVAPATALLQVAATLTVPELLVAIDSFVLERSAAGGGRPLLALETLRHNAHAFHGPGSNRYRFALEHARVGAESRMETLARYELIALGIEGFELQVNIYDDDGVWIGRFDLVDLTRKLIIEYDGEQHQTDRAQYIKDQIRLNRVWQAGFRVLRLSKEDFKLGKSDVARQKIDSFLANSPRQMSPTVKKYLGN